MVTNGYCIINEANEDRLEETNSLEEAIRIARSLVRESQPGNPVSIEHRGKVIRQLILMPDGEVTEEEMGEIQSASEVEFHLLTHYRGGGKI